MSEHEPLWLQNQLCFALYAATNAITRSYRGVLGRLGLTYSQYLVIVALLEHPQMTSGQLAQALRLDAGTLTPMLKRLAELGFIKRFRRSGDDRVIENRLTEAGLALQTGLMQAQSQVVCRTGLSGAELAALRTALNELTASLAALPAEDVEMASPGGPHPPMLGAVCC